MPGSQKHGDTLWHYVQRILAYLPLGPPPTLQLDSGQRQLLVRAFVGEHRARNLSWGDVSVTSRGGATQTLWQGKRLHFDCGPEAAQLVGNS